MESREIWVLLFHSLIKPIFQLEEHGNPRKRRGVPKRFVILAMAVIIIKRCG
jgi:hypothetical protein